jgi:hypothetical protein
VQGPSSEADTCSTGQEIQGITSELITYTFFIYVKKVKGKIIAPVLFLTEQHAMKAYWGSEGIAPRIL